MKKTTTLFLISVLIIFNFSTNAQDSIVTCNSFDTSLINLNIDTNVNWEIGTPNKTIFDSSYSNLNSIITNLNTSYENGDTSVFNVVFKNEPYGLPNYLGYYSDFEIEFNHRFITDSITDFGKVEMSLDAGNTWYDVLSPTIYTYGSNGNSHYNETTGITQNDSLLVYGNSNGWINTKASINISNMIGSSIGDSIVVKFSFITDSTLNNEGWQIDDLCMSMQIPSDINEANIKSDLIIYPNPNNGTFLFESFANKSQILRVFDFFGKEKYSTTVEPNAKQQIALNLPSGVYFVTLSQFNSVNRMKFIVK